MSPSRPKPPEYVVDTDVVVAGAAGFQTHQPPTAAEPLEAQIFRRWVGGQWRWATSQELLDEHAAVLERRGAPAERVRALLATVRENVRMVTPRQVTEVLRDQEDEHVVGTVRTAGVALVTRNVTDFIGILPKVLSPQEMIGEIEAFLNHPMTRLRRFLRI